MDDFDYGDHKPGTNDTNILQAISDTADLMRLAEQRVEAAEKEFEAAKSEYRTLAEQTMPALMEKAGMDTCRTIRGLSISVREDIRCSLPKERQAAGHRWLRDTNNADILVTQVVSEFTVGHDEEAKALAQELSRRNSSNTRMEAKVAPATLLKRIKRLLGEGVDVPKDVFGIFRQRIAKLD